MAQWRTSLTRVALKILFLSFSPLESETRDVEKSENAWRMFGEVNRLYLRDKNDIKTVIE